MCLLCLFLILFPTSSICACLCLFLVFAFHTRFVIVTLSSLDALLCSLTFSLTLYLIISCNSSSRPGIMPSSRHSWKSGSPFVSIHRLAATLFPSRTLCSFSARLFVRVVLV